MFVPSPQTISGNIGIVDGVGGVNTLEINAANQALMLASLLVSGSPLADINSLPTLSDIQQMILNSKGFTCSTGEVTAAANQAMEWFADGTQAKNVLLWSFRMGYSNASQNNQWQYITAKDAVITGAGVTHDIGNALNLKGGAAAPQSGVTMDHNSAVTVVTGTALDLLLNPLNANIEGFSPGMFLYLPAGVAGGLALYSPTTAAGKWGATVRWCEF